MKEEYHLIQHAYAITLKNYRKDAKVEREELARQSDLSEKTIYEIETGQEPITTEIIELYLLNTVFDFDYFFSLVIENIKSLIMKQLIDSNMISIHFKRPLCKYTIYQLHDKEINKVEYMLLGKIESAWGTANEDELNNLYAWIQSESIDYVYMVVVHKLFISQKDLKLIRANRIEMYEYYLIRYKGFTLDNLFTMKHHNISSIEFFIISTRRNNMENYKDRLKIFCGFNYLFGCFDIDDSKWKYKLK